MQAGIPLQDQDRLQWLAALEQDIKTALTRSLETVLTCSALKASYRQRLDLSPRVQLVWLDAPAPELTRRLQQRSGHYLTPEMLASQLAAAEPIGPHENVLTIDGLPSPAAVVTTILTQAAELFPALQQPWWQRLLPGKTRICGG
jgi:gluconokinase